MNDKVTKIRLAYPENMEPNLCEPEKNEIYRYLLGRRGKKPLVAICMNPSAANMEYSDRTINRIIKVSEKLGYDGWIIANLYPERATRASELGAYNDEQQEKNIQKIMEFLKDNGIDKVWGAWGDLNYPVLTKSKEKLLSELKKADIKIYTFATLTKKGEPVHPLNRVVKQDFSRKINFDFY
ncbi:TPA: DUF1643 domain-containing protein [Neisseria subflava]|uniref:DUF1643 domain-containing protein n=1 Tax=Neisseria sp. HMSC072C05 TaxID=1715112 RepID=UPI0008A18322|nr:DUF1643 domain-containing protein [Neisseria sp. HMSC072C05]OFM98697.1 hypothetical protein HMPREF2633_06865 [Neisseria sp. HMSC072C05]